MSIATATLDLKGFSKAVPFEINRIDPAPASKVRETADHDAVKRYVDCLDDLPPLLLIADESDKHWLADGKHRLDAFIQSDRTSVPCRVMKGTYQDAYRIACHANDIHGVLTTNADKRHRAEIAIKEFGGHSNRMIADICGVSDELVRKVRPDVQVPTVGTSTRTGKDGKSYPATNSKAKTTTAQPTAKTAPAIDLSEEDEPEQEDLESGPADTEEPDDEQPADVEFFQPDAPEETDDTPDPEATPVIVRHEESQAEIDESEEEEGTEDESELDTAPAAPEPSPSTPVNGESFSLHPEGLPVSAEGQPTREALEFMLRTMGSSIASLDAPKGKHSYGWGGLESVLLLLSRPEIRLIDGQIEHFIERLQEYRRIIKGLNRKKAP